MSSDDIICIIKENDNYVGYREFISAEATIKQIKQGKPLFTVPTVEDAIICAQSEDTEYGYYFYDFKLPVTKMFGDDSS